MALPKRFNFIPCKCFSLWLVQARRAQATIAALVTVDIGFSWFARHDHGVKFDYLALGTLFGDAIIFVATFVIMATICQGILKPMGRCEGSQIYTPHVHTHADGTVDFVPAAGEPIKEKESVA